MYICLALFCSFDLSREVVAVSLSFFDRYFATLGNVYNGNVALLASLTTLHIAIKLYDTKKIKLSTLANLSRGQFTSRDIEMMEWTILAALRWKLHPPTPYTFVEHILFFLPQEVTGSIRNGLNEVSKYLTELAICDAYFVDHANSSTIAFASILNVMEDMNYSKFSGGLRDIFLRNLSYHLNVHHCSDDIVSARKRLRKMFTVSSSGCGVMPPTAMHTTDVNCVTPHETSPVSPGQENFYGSRGVCGDDISLADRSMSSGSILSTYNLNASTATATYPTTTTNQRSSAHSVDTSKSGSRFSQKPSPRRANFLASVSPIITSSRASTMM
jgi:Cyclin, N-terminal domain/Cyclin, C-terminal domain